ncbi:shikimate dehydrogenase [bacterium]|nr:shikimate dehydrogenase [bacterium]
MRRRRLLLGLLGCPLGHSLSPLLHEHLIGLHGLSGSYRPLEVSEEEFETAVCGLQALGIQGVNVTIPYKNRIIPFLDQVEEDAAAVQAVNTVSVQDRRLIGHNTDIEGFRQAMSRHGFDPKGKMAVVLGAGGAARAIVWTVVKSGARQVHVFNRTSRRAEKLCEELALSTGFGQFEVGILVDDQIAPILATADLLVNTTSVGMWPNVARTPVHFGGEVPHLTAIDLVYNPVHTTFLASAEAAGATTIDGLDMFIYQAVESLKIWLDGTVSIGFDFENLREFLINKMR